MPDEANPNKSAEAEKLLQEYLDKTALKRGDYKRFFLHYFEAADEYTARTGKQPPPIVFNLASK